MILTSEVCLLITVSMCLYVHQCMCVWRCDHVYLCFSFCITVSEWVKVLIKGMISSFFSSCLSGCYHPLSLSSTVHIIQSNPDVFGGWTASHCKYKTREQNRSRRGCTYLTQCRLRWNSTSTISNNKQNFYN